MHMNCAVWRETFCTANSWIMPKLLLQYYTCINYLQIKIHVYTGIEHLNKMCDQIFLLQPLMKFSNKFNWCFIKIHTFVFWEMNNDKKEGPHVKNQTKLFNFEREKNDRENFKKCMTLLNSAFHE